MIFVRNHNLTGYKSGCKCGICIEANRKAQKRQRAARKARLEADPTLAEHGKPSTYTNWCCRCDPCTDAYRATWTDVPRKEKS